MMNYKLKARSHIGNSDIMLIAWPGIIANELAKALPLSDTVNSSEWEYCSNTIATLHKQLDFDFLLYSKNIKEEDLFSLKLIHDIELYMDKFEKGEVVKQEIEEFLLEYFKDENN